MNFLYPVLEAREKLAQVVKIARGDLSQREFSRRLGVSLGAVQGWEEGRSVPGTENLARIAASAGYTLESLIAHLEGKELPGKTDVEQVIQQIKYMPVKDFALVVRAVGDRLAAVAEKC